MSFCSKQTTPLHHHLHPLLLLLVDPGILFDHLDQSLLMDPGILVHHLQQLLLMDPGILSPSSTTTSSYRSWNLFHHLHQTCFFKVLEFSLSIIYNSTFFFFQIQEFSLSIIYTNFFLWILEFSLHHLQHQLVLTNPEVSLSIICTNLLLSGSCSCLFYHLHTDFLWILEFSLSIIFTNLFLLDPGVLSFHHMDPGILSSIIYNTDFFFFFWILEFSLKTKVMKGVWHRATLISERKKKPSARGGCESKKMVGKPGSWFWKDEVQHATCIAIWDQDQWACEALHLQATFASFVAAPCLLHIWASPLLPVSLPPALTRAQGKHETHF